MNGEVSCSNDLPVDFSAMSHSIEHSQVSHCLFVQCVRLTDLSHGHQLYKYKDKAEEVQRLNPSGVAALIWCFCQNQNTVG